MEKEAEKTSWEDLLRKGVGGKRRGTRQQGEGVKGRKGVEGLDRKRRGQNGCGKRVGRERRGKERH